MEYGLRLLSLERGKVVAGSVIAYSVLLDHIMYSNVDFPHSKWIETFNSQYLKDCLVLPGRVSNVMPHSCHCALHCDMYYIILTLYCPW